MVLASHRCVVADRSPPSASLRYTLPRCTRPAWKSPTRSAGAWSRSSRRRSRSAAGRPTTCGWRAVKCRAITPRSSASDGRFILKDRASRYGTFINGEQITEHPLAHGDRIRLGRERRRRDRVPAHRHRAEGGQGLDDDGDRRPAADRGAARRTARARHRGACWTTCCRWCSTRRSTSAAPSADSSCSPPRPASSSSRWRAAAAGTTLSGSSFATSRKIPEEVFRTGEPRVVADLLDGELANVHMGTVALGIRNVLCVPLRLVRYLDKAEAADVERERRIGVLYLDSREKGDADVQLDARGARNAGHRGRGRDRKRQALSRDDGEGARWSRRCGSRRRSSRRCCRRWPAPARSSPRPPRRIPCRSIGGDFYDYVDLPAGALGFALGDVAGKGPPAALLSAMMQGIFAAQAASSDSPSQTISRVNMALYRRGIESRFVTLMYGAMPPDGRLTYCNAGHNPPLILSRSGSAPTVRRLECGGPIVGLFETATFEEETVISRRRLADRVQRRGVGGDVGAAATSTAKTGSSACIEGTRAWSPAAARGALRRRARLHPRRAAERRHHRHGAEVRRMTGASADRRRGASSRSGSSWRSRSGTPSSR